MKKFATIALSAALLFSPVLVAAEDEEDYYVEEAYEDEPAASQISTGGGSSSAAGSSVDNQSTDEFVIPNSPLLRPTNIITIRSIGMGVAPENTISPAQALVLAKRAAVVDAYRQLGEKMYGIKLNAKDTVKDAIIKSTLVRTQVNAIIRNAEIQETVYKDGLCQVEMEVKLDGRRWYRILSGY